MRFCYIILSCLLAMHATAHEGASKERDAQLAVSIAADTQGQLWRVGVNQGFVEVSASDDIGQTFSKAVRVNLENKVLPHEVKCVRI